MQRIILPDKKLIHKMFFIMSTISVSLIFVSTLLQLLLPLTRGIYAGQVAIIVWPLTLLLLLICWLVCYPIMVLWVRNLQYFLEEERITIHKGIISKIQQNIPYRAITDFVLHRSLYDRFLGIGAIRVQTAGQSSTQTSLGYEGNLAGLVDYDALLQELRVQVKKFQTPAASHAGSVTLPENLQAETLDKILEELKAIRKALENN